MRELEFIFLYARPLNELDIPYFITGSIAAILYGEPRLTHDVDLVVDLERDDIDPFFSKFSNNEYYVPPVEVLNIEVARPHSGHFNLIHHKTGFKADIYLKGNDELHQWAFDNRLKEEINNSTLWMAPPEYVIIRKLMYYREGRSKKHISDIRNMLENSEDMIDVQIIKEKVELYKLHEYWNLARQSN